MAAVGVIGVYVWSNLQTKWNFQQEHAPLGINSRPPKLLQPFACDPGNGLHTGNMQSFVKNVGNARAISVNPYLQMMKVIPEHKTGDSFIDGLPVVSCDLKVKMPGTEFNLAPGMEVSPQLRQSVPRMRSTSASLISVVDPLTVN
jgi:hypothetical protein